MAAENVEITCTLSNVHFWKKIEFFNGKSDSRVIVFAA